MKDTYRMSERMRRLKGSNGRWLESNSAKVDRLVKDVFRVLGVGPAPWVGEGLAADFPYSR